MLKVFFDYNLLMLFCTFEPVKAIEHLTMLVKSMLPEEVVWLF